jgi:hypothetical protein
MDFGFVQFVEWIFHVANRVKFLSRPVGNVILTSRMEKVRKKS